MERDRDQLEHIRFLDPATEEFLKQLNNEDVNVLKEALRMVKAAFTIGKFFKWVIVTLLGIWLAGVMLWESILKVLGFFKGTPPHP